MPFFFDILKLSPDCIHKTTKIFPIKTSLFSSISSFPFFPSFPLSLSLLTKMLSTYTAAKQEPESAFDLKCRNWLEAKHAEAAKLVEEYRKQCSNPNTPVPPPPRLVKVIKSKTPTTFNPTITSRRIAADAVYPRNETTANFEQSQVSRANDLLMLQRLIPETAWMRETLDFGYKIRDLEKWKNKILESMSVDAPMLPKMDRNQTIVDGTDKDSEVPESNAAVVGEIGNATGILIEKNLEPDNNEPPVLDNGEPTSNRAHITDATNEIDGEDVLDRKSVV